MSDDPTAATSSSPEMSFERLARLVREEWPAIDATALSQTNGDEEKLVELVAKTTGHTRALVRAQVAELRRLSRGERLRSWLADLDADDLVRRASSRAKELARDLEGQAVEEASRRIKQNPLTSLLLALGLGLLLGIFIGGSRRRE
ncbi:MAG: hypothetical protein FJ095_08230 [Deltaproteobacteria bacterium]|nr:hypothetical protein [Deltaproteobacteria bacterium]